jgi:fido (protein-threonine AMPylation protein)
MVLVSKQDIWQLELNEYVRQGEPDRAEKSAAWQTAIGLQAVDGLKTSPYLLETAKAHIEGEVDITGAQRRIQSYYREQAHRQAVEDGTMEADIVSARITELLQERTFQFSPAELQSIHKRLFRGVFDHAGKYRTCNITKNEWVLAGDTVIYSSWESIRDTLDYDFSQEKQFSYETLSVAESIRHMAKFASGLWQIHPFSEGNTRTTAVFLLKYLKTFGFTVNNDVFAENSWYFRNALVRANYNNLKKGIHATNEYLELFLENLLLGAQHELKNRTLHVEYQAESQTQSANLGNPKCQNGTLNCTLEELAVLRAVKENPTITQKELAGQVGKSERTIKRRMADLQEKGYLCRANGKRSGRWEVLGDLANSEGLNGAVNSILNAFQHFQDQMKGEAREAGFLTEEDVAEWITKSRGEEVAE